MISLGNTLFRYKLAITLVILIIGVMLYNPIRKSLTPNNAISIWFNKSDPALKNYYAFQELFGNDRVIILTYKENTGILSNKGYQILKTLTREIALVDNVRNVISLTNFKDFHRVKNGGITKVVFSPWLPDTVDTLPDNLRQQIMSSPLIHDRLISKDTTMAKLIIKLENIKKVDGRLATIIPEIEKLAKDILVNKPYQLNGTDVITYELNVLSRQDFVKFTGLSYLLIFIFVTLYYRNINYLIIVFFTSFISLWFTLGIYGMLGYQLNIFTVMTPPIVISLSVIVTVHILNKFESSTLANSESKVKSSLKQLLRPCAYASLTTMAGFLSLLTSPTSVIKEFGALNALAALLAFLFPFMISAVLLPMVKTTNRSTENINRLGQKLRNLLVHNLKYSRFYIGLTLLMVIVFSVGISLVKIDMNPIGYFPKDHKVVKNHEFLTESWGDYYPMDLMLVTDSISDIYSRKTIRAMIAFNQELLATKDVKYTFSYIDFLERYAQVLLKKDLYEVINNPFLFRTYSNGLQKLIKQDMSLSMVSEDHFKAKITITGPLLTTSQLEESLAKVKLIADRNLNSQKIEIAGYPSLFLKVIKYAFDSMKFSLIVAALLVFVFIFIFLNKFKLALIAMAPNIFPVIVLLGFLGFSGINLDLATSTIAAIIIGIAIDDTIHMVYGYQNNLKVSKNIETALRITHQQTGPVVLVTSVLLSLGFSVLLFSDLMTVYYFGLISIVSIFAITYGDLVILPLLMKVFTIKR